MKDQGSWNLAHEIFQILSKKIQKIISMSEFLIFNSIKTRFKFLRKKGLKKL